MHSIQLLYINYFLPPDSEQSKFHIGLFCAAEQPHWIVELIRQGSGE